MNLKSYMNYCLCFFVACCLNVPLANAKFDPQALSKSVVRITVTGGGKNQVVASGFIWQESRYVVTSLHAMRLGADVDIQVEFNRVKRTARIDRILENADLVLLEVTQMPLPNWRPLTKFSPTKPGFQAEMMALGFNSGAPGSSTKVLKKSFSDPETLKNLLPPKDRIEIEKAGIPHIDLPIYYMEGSLLPGFSGSPVVNSNGVLVGIGDGGLENGASNVSWIIPAYNLDNLKGSPVRQLTQNIVAANQSFSAEMDAPEVYVSVTYEDYTFVKTKTRTYLELLESSSDPQGLEDLAASFFPEHNISYYDFEYDIYEDTTHGLIIVVPAGLLLMLDEDGDLLADYSEDGPYAINYAVMSAEEFTGSDQSPEAVLNDFADQYLASQNTGDESYIEEENARHIEVYTGDQYVLRSSFNDFHNELVEDKGIDYISFATNLETLFFSRAVLNRFDPEFVHLMDSMPDLNCSVAHTSDVQETLCIELEEMLWIVSSVHMTSFANAAKSTEVN